MSLLQNTLAAIKTPNTAPGRELAGKVDQFSENFGQLASILQQYANITGSSQLPELHKYTIIACGDHGVAEMQVSAYPPETTLHMTANYLISKGAAANALSNFTNSDFLVADLGINSNNIQIPNLINARIASGTANSAKGPAMSRQQAQQSIETGIQLATQCCARGGNILLPGEMGISNTTASAAITAAICQKPATATTGRGTNISDERMQKKIRIVEQILTVNQPNPQDGLDVLAKVGGFELGCIAGIILGGAAQGALTILDGFNTSAAALIATTICPAAKEYICASHIGHEKGHRIALDYLALTPVMQLKLSLGEAIGSSLLADMLETAVAICHSLWNPPAAPPASATYIHNMSMEKVSITDKTFDYYTNTMPTLDKKSMEQCQAYVDNLSKPIYSLGYIEQLAVKFAGILGEEMPVLQQKKQILFFDYNSNLNSPENVFLDCGANKVQSACTLGVLAPEHSFPEYFNFGRGVAENLSLTVPVITIGVLNQSIADHIVAQLIDDNDHLIYPATHFLEHLDVLAQNIVSAMLGAMIAAAHNHSLVVIDDKASQIIASYAVQLCPELEPYILTLEPVVYQLGIKASNGLNACLGFRLLDASLHMLNDMSSFAVAQVATATDGPGSLRQHH